MDQPSRRRPNPAAIADPMSSWVPGPLPPSPPLTPVVADIGAGVETNAAKDAAPDYTVLGPGGFPRPPHGSFEGKPPSAGAGNADGVSTAIGIAVLRNRVEIDLLAASFVVLIDERIESLREGRSNSDEVAALIADYEDLKQRIEAFLDRASQFADKKVAEASVVQATTSLADGISNYWSKYHVEICKSAFDMGLFGVGVGICSLAGASGALAVIIPGVIAGGKPVLEAITAMFKREGKE